MKDKSRVVTRKCKKMAHHYFDDMLGKEKVTKALDKRRKYAGR